MQMLVSHKVLTDNRTSEFRAFARDALYLRREIVREQATVQIDVSGPFWIFLFGAHPEEGAIVAKRQDKLQVFHGLVATLMPPFSIVEWHIKPSRFKFEAVVSTAEFPLDLGTEPFSFYPDAGELPNSVQGVLQLCRRAKPRIPIGLEEDLSTIARQAKALIDRTYHENVLLTEIAARMGRPHATVTRAFKRRYHLTPVQYRAKLRVLDAQRHLLVNDRTAMGAAISVGFEDLSQFNRQFRRETRTTPAKYRPAGPLFK